MRNLLLIPLLVLVTSLWTACSNQVRTGEPDVSGGDINNFVLEALTFGARNSSANTSVFQSLYADPNARIYYTEGPSEFGSVEGVAPMDSWSFLGSDLSALSSIDGSIKRIRIFLVEVATEQTERYSLLFHITTEQGEFVRSLDSQQVYLESGALVVEASGLGGSIILRSFDITGDGYFGDVIQLQLSQASGTSEFYVGKITTLVAYD